METLRKPLEELASFTELCEQLKKTSGLHLVTGCIDSQKTHLIDALSDGCDRTVIACSSEEKATEAVAEYAFCDDSVLYWPARDVLFSDADIRSNALSSQRMTAVRRMMEHRNVRIFTTIDAFLDEMGAFEEIAKSRVTIRFTDTLDLSELERRLAYMGYEREEQVNAVGQFAVRGGILDVYALTEENPFRIEFWGDEVDSIRTFDATSQRSIENLEEVVIYPAIERTGKETLLDYLMAGTAADASDAKDASGKSGQPRLLIVLDEPNQLFERAETMFKEFQESVRHRTEKGYPVTGSLLNPAKLWKRLTTQEPTGSGKAAKDGKTAPTRVLGLCTLDARRDLFRPVSITHMEVQGVGSYNNHFELLVKDLKRFKKEKYRILLLAGSRTRGRRLAHDLEDNELNAFYAEDPEHDILPGQVMVTYGRLYHGYQYPLIRFMVIAESDIFGREQKKRRKKRRFDGEVISSFNELHVGDYVVHENHGLGIYEGIEQIEVDHVIKDFMKVQYDKGGRLYIPATNLDVIQKYSGAEGSKPKLNRLGGETWNKTKARVRMAVDEIATELVELYAARREQDGYVYGPDTVWQKEFEEEFEFEETADQLSAIEDTKRDMESPKIMDRLICGDVGYGKTEVALRAAFKAVQESKQVAVLVPTTILAQQHYNTFVQRMRDFPVRIDLLCRFRTTAQQKKTVQDIERGQVDIVIGTHRLLSKDVHFRNLGLLVVDEEQRFGVAHKEKIKQMRENVDVLTLTATPIPRTLHMSLVGIRDMSLIEEAPTDRSAIQTYVCEYNEETVREAIRRELGRGGQVYYVYNRVDTISEVAGFIRRLVPDAEVAYAHGQMAERELEQIMVDFINGEIDVLVSTTIIETGLDIPNVNTMIIHDADQMGLSQLYQLRGRVGRSNRTAYAFLMYRRNKLLREVAEKRLKAIREFTDLGSGFKIAMRDLEIRGAGNLLGKSQHGHMSAVGYDLYCKMLNEAVRVKRGLEPRLQYETELDLHVDAYIPDAYIPNEMQKLDIYKRIAGVQTDAEAEDMLEELTDRFGDPGSSVINLLKVAVLKARAGKVGITSITQRGISYEFVFAVDAPIDPTGIPELIARSAGHLSFRTKGTPTLIYKGEGKPLSITEQMLETVEKLS